MKQINKREIEDFAAEVAAAIAATAKLMPLTTTVGGVPDLVWDNNDELVLMEVSL